LTLALIPLVLVMLNVVHAFSSYPVGVLADRFDRGTLLALGVVVLVASDLALALIGGMGGLALGVVLWGLHMGMTQGLLATLMADAAPANLRGTAFRVFNLVSVLAASIVAGALWDAFGSRGTFLAGAGVAAITVLALVPVVHRVHGRKS
jgi:MFS family permease